MQIFIPVVWAAFILWTVHRLWRYPKHLAWKKYHLAAKCYCLAMTIFASAILPSILKFPDVPYWLESVVFGVIAFPVSLWVGYGISLCFQALDR
jgi:hypothetical protein